jgi:hypothetical protein
MKEQNVIAPAHTVRESRGRSSFVIMDWGPYAVMGGLGALALEASQVALYVQRTGHTPWRSHDHKGKTDRYGQALPRLSIFCLAVFLKSATGLVVVGALAADGQVRTPAVALMLGAAATDLVRRGAKEIALPDGDSAGGRPAGKTIVLDSASASELSQP